VAAKNAVRRVVEIGACVEASDASSRRVFGHHPRCRSRAAAAVAVGITGQCKKCRSVPEKAGPRQGVFWLGRRARCRVRSREFAADRIATRLLRCAPATELACRRTLRASPSSRPEIDDRVPASRASLIAASSDAFAPDQFEMRPAQSRIAVALSVAGS